jgi:hypothetical protein
MDGGREWTFDGGGGKKFVCGKRVSKGQSELVIFLEASRLAQISVPKDTGGGLRYEAASGKSRKNKDAGEVFFISYQLMANIQILHVWVVFVARYMIFLVARFVHLQLFLCHCIELALPCSSRSAVLEPHPPK